MRIDKFLKVSRILKRRTISKELAENDRLYINDKIAKSSSKVKINDVISIHFGHKILRFRVLELKEHSKKEDSATMFEVIF